MFCNELFESVIRKAREYHSSQLFESVLREANGKVIPTNAMTDYKKQRIELETIISKIEEKFDSMAIPFNYYMYTNYEKFEEDYNNIYKNRIFTTPIGKNVKMGENQMKKLFKRDREYLLYTIKNVIEDPIVIIWKPPEKDEKSGLLIFAKSFDIENRGKKAVNSITINRDNMQIITSSYELSIEDFVDRELRTKPDKKPNKIVYVKK